MIIIIDVLFFFITNNKNTLGDIVHWDTSIIYIDNLIPIVFKQICVLRNILL